MTDPNIDPTTHQTYRMYLDPLRKYTDVPPRRLIEACGLLLPWACEALSEAGTTDSATLQEGMDKRYGFGLYEMTGSTIDESGTYTYPDDPPLHPIARVTNASDVECLIYQCGIIAFRDPGRTYVTRMD